MRFTHEGWLLNEAKHGPKMPGLYAPTSKSEVKEAEIQNDIEQYLKSLGTQCWYVRQRMDKATAQRTGIGDFVGWIKGRPFMLEVKRPGQKPTIEQQGEIRWAQLAGATAGVVTSVEEAAALLTRPVAVPSAAQPR